MNHILKTNENIKKEPPKKKLRGSFLSQNTLTESLHCKESFLHFLPLRHCERLLRISLPTSAEIDSAENLPRNDQ